MIRPASADDILTTPIGPDPAVPPKEYNRAGWSHDMRLLLHLSCVKLSRQGERAEANV